MPADSTPRSWGPVASVALVITWSSGFVGAELGARAGAAPITLLGWRFSLLALGLAGLWLVLRKPMPTWSAWRRQALLATLCQFGYLIFLFEGISHGVSGGTTALIAALQPLLVATAAGPVLGEHPTGAMWLGMVIGLVGVGIVVSGDLNTSHIAPATFLLPAMGMLSLAVGTVLTRRLHPPEDLLESISMQAVVTAILFLVVATMTGQVAVPADPGFWAAVVWLLVLASLGGYVMYVFVTRTEGPTVVSTLLYLTPPTAMLWIWLMFGRPITPVAVLGLAVSAVGVVLVLRGRRAAA